MTHYNEQREAEAEQERFEQYQRECEAEDMAYHIRAIAAGIRAKRQISGLGSDIRDAVWAARNRAELFHDCREIMNAFPNEFLLSGARASE